MVLENSFTPIGGGGAESQVRTLALHLRHLGHQVTVLTPRLPYGPRPTAERCWGLPVGRLPYPYVRIGGALVMFARLAAFLVQRRNRYDVWHVHIAHHMGAITCFLGGLLGKTVVVKVSGWFELERGVLASGRSPTSMLARRWFKSAAALQAISTRIARTLVDKGFPAQRVVTLPNAVDTSRFRPRGALRTAGRALTVVYVGRLVPEKGLETLFDAWSQAYGGRDHIRLLLVGGGPLEGALRERAERLGIAKQLEFLGHQDRVEDVLAKADLGVLASLIEGLSNTLLELMAAGVPVVASRVSGSEDLVIPGRNGWLFPPLDVASLAACLREAEALSPERLTEMGRQARADVEATAGLDVIVKRLLALYRGDHSMEVAGRGTVTSVAAVAAGGAAGAGDVAAAEGGMTRPG
jgi:glycosyltransferase involved in cell wall biosynthesis